MTDIYEHPEEVLLVAAKVIEAKRHPPLWAVKAGNRYRAQFIGPDARAKAEAFATEAYGGFTLVLRAMPRREARRLDSAASD